MSLIQLLVGPSFHPSLQWADSLGFSLSFIVLLTLCYSFKCLLGSLLTKTVSPFSWSPNLYLTVCYTFSSGSANKHLKYFMSQTHYTIKTHYTPVFLMLVCNARTNGPESRIRSSSPPWIPLLYSISSGHLLICKPLSSSSPLPQYHHDYLSSRALAWIIATASPLIAHLPLSLCIPSSRPNLSSPVLYLKRESNHVNPLL